MSESNSLVKLFNDIMKGMDDDDGKKVEQFTPEGVPAMIARPPEPPSGRPLTSEYVDTGVPHFETRLDDPNRGIIQPDGRMGTHQMRAEIDPATGKMTAFPMIVDMPGLDRLHQFQDPGAALDYNKSLNNVKVFDDPQKGIDYAKGGYKKDTALAPTDQQEFSRQFGGVPLMGEVPKVESKVPSVKKDSSAKENVISKKEQPSFIDKALASAGLPSTNSMKREASEELSRFGNAFSSPEAFGRELAHSLSVPVETIKKGTDLTTAGIETVGDPFVRFGQGFAGTDVTGIEKGSFGRYYPEEQTEEQKVPSIQSQSEIPTLDEPLKVEKVKQEVEPQKVEQEVVSSNQAVVDPNNQNAKSLIDVEVARLREEGLPRGMMGDDGSFEFEGSVDPDKLPVGGNSVKVEDPKQGFLSKIWNGVKDVVVDQFQDPANQRALFAYAVSRALGYDGVTFATQVLSNEWEVEAATAKHERELEKLYGKENLAALKKQQENQTIDYSKPVTVFNPASQENYTVFMTKDKQGFVFDDGGTEPFTVSTLLKGGYSIGEGLDFADQQQLLSDLMEKEAKTYVATISDSFLNPDLKGEERDNVKKALALASAPPVIRAAMTSFTNKYGRGTDFTTAEIKTMASNGINNYLLAVSDGRAKGSKDLIGYMDYEQIKYKITDNGIPSSFFTISGEEDQKIGVNGWSRTNNVVNKVTNNINSRLGKGSYTNTDIYKVLADEFNKKQGDEEFMTFWNKASKNSAEDKAEALSPAMLWVQSIMREDVSPSYKAPSLTEVLDMLAKRKG